MQLQSKAMFMNSQKPVAALKAYVLNKDFTMESTWSLFHLYCIRMCEPDSISLRYSGEQKERWAMLAAAEDQMV